MSEEKGAIKADFEGVEHLRWQFEQWGLPEWFIQGDVPKPEERRRAGNARGEALELPPAKGSAPLFREALNKLLEDVQFLEFEYENESSRRYNKEYLQDGQFLQYTREEVSWADPSLGRTRFAAAGRAPGSGLTRLIAAYLLAYEDPDPLIEKLHYNPSSLDREKLRKHVEGQRTPKGRKPGLLGSAEDVAILVRGGDLKPGAGPGELTRYASEGCSIRL